MGRKRLAPFVLPPLLLALTLVSQAAMTPLGEQMDLWGHVGYLAYVSAEGKVPRPGEPTIPASFSRKKDIPPGPDHTPLGSRYAGWQALSAAERSERRAMIDKAETDGPYDAPNYEAQQPPLYYFVLSPVYRLAATLPFSLQIYLLTAVSVLIAGAGMPAVYLLYRRHFSSRDALLLSAIVAWFPNLMPFLGRPTNDTLSFALASWTAYFISRPDGLVLAAIFAGAGLFSKSYALVFLPAIVLSAAFWLMRGECSVRCFIKAAAACVLVFGVLVLFNLQLTGHWLQLLEVKDTVAIPFSAKLKALVTIDPVWFFLKGMLRLSIWSGFWSFAAPGALFFVPPIVALMWSLTRAAVTLGRKESRAKLVPLLPHLLLAGFFILGLLWHAAQFAVRRELAGVDETAGNEGWYLCTILPSLLLIVALPIARSVSAVRWRKALQTALLVSIGWNIWARLSLAAFWSGGTPLRHFLRSIDAPKAAEALSRFDLWSRLESVPGIITPLLWTSAVPLFAAAALTVILALLPQPAEDCE